MSIIRFDNVDVIFAKDPREALGLLDQGMTRDQILKKTGQIVGVEKANLDIDKGEICVLMGLSGSGKSSLLRCINGLNTVSVAICTWSMKASKSTSPRDATRPS